MIKMVQYCHVVVINVEITDIRIDQKGMRAKLCYQKA